MYVHHTFLIKLYNKTLNCRQDKHVFCSNYNYFYQVFQTQKINHGLKFF